MPDDRTQSLLANHKPSQANVCSRQRTVIRVCSSAPTRAGGCAGEYDVHSITTRPGTQDLKGLQTARFALAPGNGIRVPGCAKFLESSMSIPPEPAVSGLWGDMGVGESLRISVRRATSGKCMTASRDFRPVRETF